MLVYLDSVICIYAVEGAPSFQVRAKARLATMPKILDNGTFRVYVYANDDNPHHLPHCHVYWDGNDHASVVSLPDLVVIVGAAPPRAARRYLRANVDVLVAAWRRLNP